MVYRLITIPFSHYCEKARWALDRVGVDYVEEGHAPLFHRLANKRYGAGTTVPVLVPGAAPPVGDSTDILRYLEKAHAPQAFYPESAATRREVEDLARLFDEKLGPAVRRVVYFHLLQDRQLSLSLMTQALPRLEQAGIKLLFPVVRTGIRKGLKITAEKAASSEARMNEIFAQVSARLADGRRYLVGGRFTAADLSFCALGAPAVTPAEYGVALPELSRLPVALREASLRLRATPAGEFILRIYREERRRSGA